LLQGQLNAGLEALNRLFRHGQGGFKAVLDGQQFACETFDGKLVRLGNVILGAAADVFAFRLGAQPGIVVFGGLQFEGTELFLDARQGVRTDINAWSAVVSAFASTSGSLPRAGS
jgi:hypothetical protein